MKPERLTLRWRRVEPGLWAAALYVLKKVRKYDLIGGRTRFFWRVYRDDHKWRRCKTLANAKELCAHDYAQRMSYPVVEVTS